MRLERHAHPRSLADSPSVDAVSHKPRSAIGQVTINKTMRIHVPSTSTTTPFRYGLSSRLESKVDVTAGVVVVMPIQKDGVHTNPKKKSLKIEGRILDVRLPMQARRCARRFI